MDLRLDGKVVLVTGGAGRIGPVICATFAREGARVGVLDIDGARAETTAANLRDAGSPSVAVQADVSSAGEVAAALQQVTTLAIELGPYGIRVNAVAPGLVTDTALRSSDPSVTPYIRMMLEMTPLGRTGAPTDIAEVIVFVASDLNAWMTGSIIDVSGGSHTGRPHAPLPRPPQSH